MKRTLIFLLSLSLITIAVSAQTQQGYVKTKGRMVNGQHVPGKGLSGATVTVRGGNVVVSSGTGAFALVIEEKVLGPDHPDTRKIKESIEHVEQEMNRQ